MGKTKTKSCQIIFYHTKPVPVYFVGTGSLFYLNLNVIHFLDLMNTVPTYFFGSELFEQLILRTSESLLFEPVSYKTAARSFDGLSCFFAIETNIFQCSPR